MLFIGGTGAGGGGFYNVGYPGGAAVINYVMPFHILKFNIPLFLEETEK